MADCRAKIRDVINKNLPEGSTAEITIGEVIEEAEARHAFDDLGDTLRHLGKIRIIHDEMERLVDSDGRRLIVSTRRQSRRLVESDQVDLFGETQYVFKRASALRPGEERAYPLERCLKHFIAELRRQPGVVVSDEKAKAITAFVRRVLADDAVADQVLVASMN